jgi:predicted dienelactone hydrolase
LLYSFFRRRGLFLAILAFFILAVQLPLFAQERVNAPRADGHITPLRVYRPAGAVSGCAPLAVISHGAGGSENGYRYLAEAMSKMGFTAIVMGHHESDGSTLRCDMFRYGIKQGVRKLVTDPRAEEARLLDVGAALNWAAQQCKAPYRVLLGHSMGSETVMLEAGARNMIGVPDPPAGQDRFDAYVALSPEGPGIVFPDEAWAGIRKPLLVLTGTRDQELQGGPLSRQVPWRELPGNAARCQWMGVIKGATHMNFAGIGFGARRVNSLVTRTIAAFLNGARKGKCTLQASTAGITLQAK